MSSLASLGIPANDAAKPLLGISEWMCWYANYGVPCEGISAIDHCIDAHLASGVNHLVWNCGRSTVDYWSELPNTTRMCERGSQVGAISWQFVAHVMDRVCPLRRAMKLCRRSSIPIYGRLSMNRHYGTPGSEGLTSLFAADNPQFLERSKPGNPVTSRLCYAIEQVRRERIDILLEIQRIGVDAIVLDFCRQMPMLMYHDALVEPFRAKTGVDARTIDSTDPADYHEWFQHRADVLTEFVARLREQTSRQEAELGRDCPIIARVPDAAPWLMVAYGLDVERWFADDLIDATMLSPFPRAVEDLASYPEYHADLAHRHGKPCIGGIGSMKLIENDTVENTGFYHEQPVLALAARQHAAGVDAISLYQSETLVRMGYLEPLLSCLPDPDHVARRASKLPVPDLPESHPLGQDWHSRPKGQEGLRVDFAGDFAL